MRYKGKLIMWNSDRAFGFIQPIVGGADVFIHKTALSNNKRTPQINDIITYSTSKDKSGRYCAGDATFLGEELKDKKSQKNSDFSIYLSFVFLTVITAAYFIGQFPQKLLLGYFGFSLINFIAHAFDKSKAQRGAWRIKESTLHFFSLVGGWPGAAIAQQLLRHKSQKREFRFIFWFTVLANIASLIFFYSSSGSGYMRFLY